ncbi:MAG TPA: hypothetical protein DEP23_07430, partial [Ruminococcaceae bacterium]|nr:hypothetical protein [Oscillospiraceae bacterium]
RETDIIGRIGGDEFLIFLQDIDNDHIVEMAQNLLSSLSSFKVKACPGSYKCLSVSIGIETGIPQTGDSLKEFYNRADMALYHAKKSGRNCISYDNVIIKNPNERVWQNESSALKNLVAECARK